MAGLGSVGPIDRVQLVQEVPAALVRAERLTVHVVGEPLRDEALWLERAHLVLPLLELRL